MLRKPLVIVVVLAWSLPESITSILFRSLFPCYLRRQAPSQGH